MAGGVQGPWFVVRRVEEGLLDGRRRMFDVEDVLKRGFGGWWVFGASFWVVGVSRGYGCKMWRHFRAVDSLGAGCFPAM